MGGNGKSFSVVRLNAMETGWGVVDDGTGALVHLDGNGIAIRLTRERAQDVAAKLNEEASESGSAGDDGS